MSGKITYSSQPPSQKCNDTSILMLLPCLLICINSRAHITIVAYIVTALPFGIFSHSKVSCLHLHCLSAQKVNLSLHITPGSGFIHQRHLWIIHSCSSIIQLDLRKIVLQIRLVCSDLCLMYIRQILRCQYSHQHCHDSYYNDQLY